MALTYRPGLPGTPAWPVSDAAPSAAEGTASLSGAGVLTAEIPGSEHPAPDLAEMPDRGLTAAGASCFVPKLIF